MRSWETYYAHSIWFEKINYNEPLKLLLAYWNNIESSIGKHTTVNQLISLITKTAGKSMIKPFNNIQTTFLET